MGAIRVGCSGFSYEDWVGPFYPEGTPASAYLTEYAKRFDTVEINTTYYRIPEPKLAEGWVRRTPEGFLFSVKANRLMTHDLGYPDCLAPTAQYLEAIRPIAEAGRLGCVLLQFPNGFRPTVEARDQLAALIDALRPHPVVAEFRRVEWLRESVPRWLAKRGAGYCCVDEPDLPGLMPRQTVATGGIAYIRFHGRNRQKWYNHNEAWERYDYLYSEEELREWVEPVREMAAAAGRAFVYMNNHRMGQAPQNAETFRDLLDG